MMMILIFIFRCRIPECGESSKIETYNPEWILNAIPGSKTGFSSCDRYAPTEVEVNGSLDYCPAEIFDRDNVVGCEGFVYANDYSVVYDVRNFRFWNYQLCSPNILCM